MGMRARHKLRLWRLRHPDRPLLKKREGVCVPEQPCLGRVALSIAESIKIPGARPCVPNQGGHPGGQRRRARGSCWLGQPCRVATSVRRPPSAANQGPSDRAHGVTCWKGLPYHLRVTMRCKMPTHCSSSRSHRDCLLSCTVDRPIARSPPVEFFCCREACRIANRWRRPPAPDGPLLCVQPGSAPGSCGGDPAAVGGPVDQRRKPNGRLARFHCNPHWFRSLARPIVDDR